MKERDTSIDLCKGIAMTIVVMGHVLRFVMNDPDGELSTFIGNFEMPFFFMLSGYFAWKPQPYNITFWLKKVRTLLLPMLTVGGVFALVYNHTRGFFLNTFHAGYWYFLALFEMWIILVVMKSIVNWLHVKNILLEFILLILPFIIMKGVVDYIPFPIAKALTLQLTPSHYRWFILGYFLGKTPKMKNLFMHEGIIAICLVIIFAILLAYITDAQWITHIPLTFQQCAISMALYSLCCFINREFNGKTIECIRNVGVKSLQVYVFHYFLLYLFSIPESMQISPGFRFVIVIILTLFLMFSSIGIGNIMGHNKYLAFLFLGSELKKTQRS